MSDLIAEYERAVKSGCYKPPTMPEPDPSMDTEPVTETVAEPAKPLIPNKLKKLSNKILFALSLLFLALSLWLTRQENPQLAIEQLLDGQSITEEIPRVPAVPITPGPIYTRPAEPTKDAEPPYMQLQRAALAQIAAWERVHMHLIDQFFNTPVPAKTKRTLCITMGGKKDCATRTNPLNSIP